MLPQPFGETKTQLISLQEGVGKIRAALDGRRDPSLVVLGRTGAVSITASTMPSGGSAYEPAGIDALFLTGIKNRAEIEAISTATRLPIVLAPRQK